MKFGSASPFCAAFLLFASCSGGNDSTSTQPGLSNGGTLSALTGDNVLSITVNGSLCSKDSYRNKPCVSVKICAPGTTNCQTINDVLVDTGSSGLRLFKSVITVSLTQVTNNAQSVAQCMQFGDGSADWGPVKTADVVLGDEPAARANIQVIDSSFSNSALYCNGADQSPAVAGFNGILGVGLFAQDCGTACAQKKNNQIYYRCTGTSCTTTTITLSQQVQNPVALLPKDNNGVIVELPSISFGGVPSLDGYLVLGIGTESNNVPTDATTYPANPTLGSLSTKFNGQTYPGFVDTGSNTFDFPAPSTLPDCSSTDQNFSGFFCPTSLTSLSAVNSGYSGSSTGTVKFQIGNFINLFNSANNVFIEVGGSATGMFDWGLPFFVGRNVYVGIEGTTSQLGTGPYWAF